MQTVVLGHYRKVMENIRKIRHNGYHQELVRMTVNESISPDLLMQSTGWLTILIIPFPLFTGNWMQILLMIFHIAVLQSG